MNDKKSPAGGIGCLIVLFVLFLVFLYCCSSVVACGFGF